MSATKLLRNDGERAVKIEYAGNDHFLDAGEEREVDELLAASAQHRYSHLGIKIVTPPVKEVRGVKVSAATIHHDVDEVTDAEMAKDKDGRDVVVRRGVKATRHPGDLSAVVAPELDLPLEPKVHASRMGEVSPVVRETAAGYRSPREIAVDRHEEPAFAPPAEHNPDPGPAMAPRPDLGLPPLEKRPDATFREGPPASVGSSAAEDTARIAQRTAEEAEKAQVRHAQHQDETVVPKSAKGRVVHPVAGHDDEAGFAEGEGDDERNNLNKPDQTLPKRKR